MLKMADLCGLSKTAKTVIVLFGCILVHLTLGSRYVMINFSTYITSYIRKRATITSATNVDFIWQFTVGFPGRIGGAFLGGILARKFGARKAVSIGAVIYVSSILICGVAIKHSLLVFLLVFVGYGSCGMMICYAVAVQTAVQWLTDRPAFATGLVLMGIGAGTLIFNPLVTMYINPDNILPNQTVAGDNDRYFTDDALLNRVPWCFVLVGGIFVVMMIIAILCLFPAPADVVIVKSTSDEIHECEHNGMDMQAVKDAPTVDEGTPLLNAKSQHDPVIQKDDGKPRPLMNLIKEVLRTRAFYVIWVTDFTIQISVIFVITMNKAYGQTFISDDQYLALVGSVGAIFNCIMRPTWGLVLDRLGFKTTMRIMSFGITVTIATFVLTEHMHKVFFMLWTASLFGFYAGFTMVAPSVLSRLFGPENIALNMGLTMTADGLAGVIDGFVGPVVKESLGWHSALYMCAVSSFIPFLATFFFNGKDREGRSI